MWGWGEIIGIWNFPEMNKNILKLQPHRQLCLQAPHAPFSRGEALQVVCLPPTRERPTSARPGHGQKDKHLPFFRLSLRLRCLLTKQAASVLKRMAAARKQMVATIPANTGRASPSSVRSGCGKMSARKARSTHGSHACPSFPTYSDA